MKSAPTSSEDWKLNQNEISMHTHMNGWSLKHWQHSDWCEQAAEGTHSLLEGMQAGQAMLEDSLGMSYKAK